MFIALSLALPVLFGMGWLVLSLQPALVREPPSTRQDAARLLALSLLLGLLANYALVLVIGSIVASFGAAILLAGAGLFLAFRTSGAMRGVLRLGWPAWSVIAVISCLTAVPILFLPLTDWDARSIWFFHAKMIFYNSGTMNAAAGWDQPFAAFSHVGYPKLAPILAAQFASAAGFWNEYLPKAALLVLLVPALIGMASFVRKPALSMLFLIITGILNLGGWLWNGYMDGYLACYAGLAALSVACWLSGGDQRDALLGLASLAMAASLKSEGTLVVVCVLACLALVVLFERRRGGSLRALPPWQTWLVAAAAFLGPAVWQALTYLWGLPSEMPSSPADVHLIGTRLREGAATVIGETLLIKADVAKAAGMLACAAIACWFVKKRVPVSVGFTALIAGLYGAAMFWIYLTTNADLAWHLGTSANRTMMTVVQLLCMAAFLALSDLESEAAAPPPKRPRR